MVLLSATIKQISTWNEIRSLDQTLLSRQDERHWKVSALYSRIFHHQKSNGLPFGFLLHSGDGIHEMLFFPDSPMQLSRFFAELLRSPAFSDFFKQARKRQKRLEFLNLATSLKTCTKPTQRTIGIKSLLDHTLTPGLLPACSEFLILLDGG